MSSRSETIHHPDGSIEVKFAKPAQMYFGAAAIEHVLRRYYLKGGKIHQRRERLGEVPEWAESIDRENQRFGI